jgi:hypothetical protein
VKLNGAAVSVCSIECSSGFVVSLKLLVCCDCCCCCLRTVVAAVSLLDGTKDIADVGVDDECSILMHVWVLFMVFFRKREKEKKRMGWQLLACAMCSMASFIYFYFYFYSFCM